MKLIGQTFSRPKNINRSKSRVVSGVRDVSIQPGRRCTAAGCRPSSPGMAQVWPRYGQSCGKQP